MTPREAQESTIWSLGSFYVGEERVTTQFSGLVMAYEDESPRPKRPQASASESSSPMPC